MYLIENQHIYCAHCGEKIEIVLDYSAGPQKYIEDCEICCRPLLIEILFDLELNPVVRIKEQD